jgi:DNA-directed RNA polymerase omega subunit
MDKKLSRGPNIDIEQCVSNAGDNRFNLVIMAAARAREIAIRHKNSGSSEMIYPSITALLEFQEGKYGADFIKRVK